MDDKIQGNKFIYLLIRHEVLGRDVEQHDQTTAPLRLANIVVINVTQNINETTNGDMTVFK